MPDINPFSIATTEQELADLKQRLALTRWPDEETPNDWSQGIPLAYMKEIQEYWVSSYDWPSRLEQLNRWPGYKTEIDGLDFHFLHIRSDSPTAVPLVLTHGWPGSIVEFQKVIGPLTDPASFGGDDADAFHLVIPTLPGFGYSGKPAEPGWNIERIASAWDDLMLRLGYDQYYAQGGDWGAIVTAAIGIQNKGHCRGIHTNMPIAPPDPEQMDDLTELEQRALAAMQFYQEHDSGYSKQQSTRPQTLGYGLADSPIGQAAWILEKFWAWTDCNGHPENALGRDEMLDNVMLYWLPGTGASSARLYWESFNGVPMDAIKVPVGCSIFPKEIFRSSRRWAEKHYGDNLVYWNVLEQGGHFAAFEQPEVFVNEVRAAFRHAR